MWYLRDKKFLKLSWYTIRKLKKQSNDDQAIELYHKDRIKRCILECIADEYVFPTGDASVIQTENAGLIIAPRGIKLLNLNIKFLAEEYRILWTASATIIGIIIGIVGSDFFQSIIGRIINLFP